MFQGKWVIAMLKKWSDFLPPIGHRAGQSISEPMCLWSSVVSKAQSQDTLSSSFLKILAQYS